MIDPNYRQLAQTARLFREAVIQCRSENFLLSALKHFPYGACGDAALLLGEYLYQQGDGNFDYILGQRSGHSHAWLNRDGLIADVTADQFQDQNCPVMVTLEQDWHSAFNGEYLHPARIDIYDSRATSWLRHDYALIMKHLHHR